MPPLQLMFGQVRILDVMKRCVGENGFLVRAEDEPGLLQQSTIVIGEDHFETLWRQTIKYMWWWAEDSVQLLSLIASSWISGERGKETHRKTRSGWYSLHPGRFKPTLDLIY